MAVTLILWAMWPGVGLLSQLPHVESGKENSSCSLRWEWNACSGLIALLHSVIFLKCKSGSVSSLPKAHSGFSSLSKWKLQKFAKSCKAFVTCQFPRPHQHCCLLLFLPSHTGLCNSLNHKKKPPPPARVSLPFRLPGILLYRGMQACSLLSSELLVFGFYFMSLFGNVIFKYSLLA